jgi:predicted aldo/keto reductase-like oxidoreductase
MPLNIMDAQYDSFEKKVLPVALKNNIGILGMKPMGAGTILKSNTVTPLECLHYAMSLPVSVVITGCESLTVLRQALAAAKSFNPLTQRKRSALLAKSAKAASGGKYELYKTDTRHDGTRHNPQWLG